MKKYLFIIVGIFISLGVFQFTLDRFANNNLSVGCHPSNFTGLVDPTETVAFWENRPLVPLTVLADTLSNKQKQVLGTSTGDKWIEIDLGKQKHTRSPFFTPAALRARANWLLDLSKSANVILESLKSTAILPENFSADSEKYC